MSADTQVAKSQEAQGPAPLDRAWVRTRERYAGEVTDLIWMICKYLLLKIAVLGRLGRPPGRTWLGRLVETGKATPEAGQSGLASSLLSDGTFWRRGMADKRKAAENQDQIWNEAPNVMIRCMCRHEASERAERGSWSWEEVRGGTNHLR